MLKYKFFSKFIGKCLITAAAIILTVAANPAAAKPIAPDDSSLQYFGRWEKTTEGFASGYGATYVKANFHGTGITLYSGGDHSWWRYSIDGGPLKKFQIENEKTILAKDLPQGKHSLFLVRSTEGEAGTSIIKGFELDGDGKLLPPDRLKSRRLEIVGDSISAGACNDGDQRLPWHDKGDNNMAFGAQLARMLNADFSIVAKSGEGVIRNYAEKSPCTGIHTADRYSWTKYSKVKTGSHNIWDFTKFRPDGVIIALGTNDFSITNPHPDEKDFVRGYMQLIGIIRKYNPAAAIICTEPVPTSISRDAAKYVAKAVDMTRALGDNKVYYIPLNEKKPLLKPSDYVGDETHPTQRGAYKIAVYLKDKVAKILNWL